MRVVLPGPLGSITNGYMVQLLQQLTRLLGPVVTTDEAVHRIILQSTDPATGALKAWDVKVDSTGALVVTANTGTPP